MRIAYFGPPGTYTHEALLAGGDGTSVEELPLGTIHEVVMAVQDGEAERGVVPIENSLQGSVTATLDALAFEARDVTIVGESVLAIHHCLIARAGTAIEEVDVVVSHPQALAQCAGFLRTRLPGASVLTGTSTAGAVRTVVDERRPWAALGPRAAADRYGGAVIAADVEDAAGNETRFAWLARGAVDGDPGGPAAPVSDSRRFRTAIAFWPQESDHPGWLVDTLAELSSRGVNMIHIESRPRKVGLGEYVFFTDVDGALGDPAVAEGLRALRAHVSELRVLGSFPAAAR